MTNDVIFCLLTSLVGFFGTIFADEVQNNVFGDPLKVCSVDPLTGWHRDGFCRTDEFDSGTHTVCAQMTLEVVNQIPFSGRFMATLSSNFRFINQCNKQKTILSSHLRMKNYKATDLWCRPLSQLILSFKVAYHGLI